MEVDENLRRETDNSDTCLVGADLHSANDVYDELFGDKPVRFSYAARRVDYEHDVTTTVAGHFGIQRERYELDRLL